MIQLHFYTNAERKKRIVKINFISWVLSQWPMLLCYNHNITDYYLLSHFSKKICRPASCNVYLTQLLREAYTALKQRSKEIHFEELVFPSITSKDFVAAS